jgi:hypothetical protein
LEVAVLFEDELVFELEVLGSAETDACLVEVLLERVAVVLKSVDLPLEEVNVVFGGRFTAYTVGQLLLQFTDASHLTVIIYKI